MKLYFSLLCFSILFSCQEDEAKREVEKIKDLKKKEMVFQAISKSWVFNMPSLQPQAQSLVSNWPEWRLFLSELQQKPKSSIGAFQQKSKTLTKKVSDLNIKIPPQLSNPSVKSRIAVLTTQIRSLDLYLNLQNIPEKNVIALIPEINASLVSLTAQFEEIVRKNQIPIEQGESDMIRMLDTSRAIPSSKNNIIVPQI